MTQKHLDKPGEVGKLYRRRSNGKICILLNIEIVLFENEPEHIFAQFFGISFSGLPEKYAIHFASWEDFNKECKKLNK